MFQTVIVLQCWLCLVLEAKLAFLPYSEKRDLMQQRQLSLLLITELYIGLTFLLEQLRMLLEHGQRGHFGSSKVGVEVTVIRCFFHKGVSWP